jgi:hypothetical protein
MTGMPWKEMLLSHEQITHQVINSRALPLVSHRKVTDRWQQLYVNTTRKRDRELDDRCTRHQLRYLLDGHKSVQLKCACSLHVVQWSVIMFNEYQGPDACRAKQAHETTDKLARANSTLQMSKIQVRNQTSHAGCSKAR